MENVHLNRAYAEGVRRALTDELTKEAGLGRAIGGIPKALRGGLWGAGIGGAHGALFGGGSEDDILRGAMTGGLIGTGVGYGSRYLTPRLGEITKSAPKKLWAAKTPEAREMAFKNVGKAYERLMQDPAERQALGRGLKSMGILGVGGGIAAGPLYNRAQRSSQPSYDQLYQYYLQNAYRGMR